jgi:hypothetical protein
MREMLRLAILHCQVKCSYQMFLSCSYQKRKWKDQDAISLSRTFLVVALKASVKVVRRHIRWEENKRLNPAGFHRYDTILVLECP